MNMTLGESLVLICTVKITFACGCKKRLKAIADVKAVWKVNIKPRPAMHT